MLTKQLVVEELRSSMHQAAVLLQLLLLVWQQQLQRQNCCTLSAGNAMCCHLLYFSPPFSSAHHCNHRHNGGRRRAPRFLGFRHACRCAGNVNCCCCLTDVRLAQYAAHACFRVYIWILEIIRDCLLCTAIDIIRDRFVGALMTHSLVHVSC